MSEIYHAVVTYSLDHGWGVEDYAPIDGAVFDPASDTWIAEDQCSEGQRQALDKMRECLDMMTDRQNKRTRGA